MRKKSFLQFLYNVYEYVYINFYHTYNSHYVSLCKKQILFADGKPQSFFNNILEICELEKKKCLLIYDLNPNPRDKFHVILKTKREEKKSTKNNFQKSKSTSLLNPNRVL